MKKFTQFTLLLATILGFASQANAALLIEPVLGYSIGKFNQENTPGDGYNESAKGMSYGGRLGYQNLGFQLGLDYLSSAMDVDGNDFSTGEWAGFVGFEFPILFRVYAGYVFSGTGKLEGDNGDESKFEGASGPKLGVGFTLLPFLDVNIEYRRVTYDSEKTSGITTDTDYSATMLSFSVPFTL